MNKPNFMFYRNFCHETVQALDTFYANKPFLILFQDTKSISTSNTCRNENRNRSLVVCQKRQFRGCLSLYIACGLSLLPKYCNNIKYMYSN